MSKESGAGKTSWIYRLTKAQVIEELEKFKVEADSQAPIDVLRQRLSREIKQQASQERLAANSSGETKPFAEEGQDAGKDERGESGEVSTNTEVNTALRMTEKAAKLEFQLGVDDWDTFIERLELYFLAKDIEAEGKKKAVLLTRVNAQIYTLIRDLCTPHKPVTKTYAELNKLVKEHLCPKPSKAMEWCKFHQAAQLESETVAQCAARLKNLLIHCNFTELSTALRDQLICGIRDHDARVELFAEAELTYDKAYKLAIAREMAKKNANSTSTVVRESTAQQEINAVGY